MIPVGGAAFAAIFCESSLHGMYTVLFVTLLQSFRKSRRNQAKISWMATTIQSITILMYILSTAHLILALQIDYTAFAINRNADSVFNRLGGYPTSLAQLGIEFTNCVLADSILIWRVWVLWNCRWIVVVFPICLVLASATSSYGFVYQVSKINSTSAEFSDVFNPQAENWSLVFGSCILVTNLLCTGLIASRIWWQNRQLQITLGRRMASRRYQAIFFAILESGAIYSAAWIILIVLELIGSNAVFTVVDSVAQITGIVPALIVVLISRSVNGLQTTYTAPSYPMFRHRQTATTNQFTTTEPVAQETPIHLVAGNSLTGDIEEQK
ncbi:hypothetical protein DFJ43DRAFT_1046543 [Lentinula guzmanii]|uniref:Uncharacterized protein n=1 Tax=Lentinula guzmanii TaxID=2804957 RepID=A0AA38JYG8_9AGAR|nr:hypothetical protein DFJ43DRAFT_1046543 [Lentinula guzmanii]